jgi:hypothetical protein
MTDLAIALLLASAQHHLHGKDEKDEPAGNLEGMQGHAQRRQYDLAEANKEEKDNKGDGCRDGGDLAPGCGIEADGKADEDRSAALSRYDQIVIKSLISRCP